MNPRAFAELLRAQTLETLRSKAALFWTLAFPCFFLFLFGGVMGRGDARQATYMMPGLFTNMLLGGTLFALAMRLVSDREAGVLRRYRLTPVPPASVVCAHGAGVFVTQLVTFFLLWGLGAAAFGVTVLGSPVTFVLTFALGLFALLPLGLLVGSTARDSRSAPVLSNVLFFPMMFLSGAAFPFAFLPDAVQRVARILPPTHVVEALHGVMVRGDTFGTLAPRLLVLLALGIVGIAATAFLFRWEGTQPLPRRRVAVVAAVLTAAFAAAAWLSPALANLRAPWTRTPEAGRAAGQVRVLRGMTVIDGLGGRLENARVTIRDHRIEAITSDSTASLTEGAIVDDLAGRFLVPGLIDSHVHLGGAGGMGTSPMESRPERQIRDTQVLLAVGVTGIVSLTDDVRDMNALREAVARGAMRAPRTFFAGPSVTAPGGHPTELFSFSPALTRRLTREVASPEDAQRAVNGLSFRHPDVVKLVLESGRAGHALPRMSDETFRAAVTAAQKARLRTTVHVSTDADARLAVDAGADGLEHVPCDLSDETIRLMALKKMTFTPTLNVFEGGQRRRRPDQDPVVRRWAEPALLASLIETDSAYQRAFARNDVDERFQTCTHAVARAARAGVPILAGSDSGNPGAFHGPALLRELELLVERGGLAPLDALAAATSRAADRLGQKELGRIAPRAVADLVVLGADPTSDIQALRDVRSVYLGGLPLDPAQLLETSPGPWVPGQYN